MAVKDSYLKLVDLIRECRLKEPIGRLGRTHIPKEKIAQIINADELEDYLNHLKEDGILRPIDGGETTKLFLEIGEEPNKKLIVYCLRPAEEILAYKKSLMGYRNGPGAPIFTSANWESIRIRFITDREVVVTTSHDGQRHSDFDALGFLNHKTGKPNSAWALLRGMSSHNGEVPRLSNPIPEKIKQQKRALTKGLQKAFGLQTDPFYPYREEHAYKIKIMLEPVIDDVEHRSQTELESGIEIEEEDDYR